MGNSEGVSQLVQHFFDDALAQQVFIGGKAVKLLAQTAERDDGNGTVEMRLSKEESEHRNRQVHVGDAEHADGIRGSGLSQHFMISTD